MSLIKKFSKDTLYYGIGHSLKKFIGFLLLPFYTRALSPADYGILETLSTGVLIFSILFGFKIVEAGSRYYYKTDDKREKGIILFTVHIISLLSIFPSLVLSAFSENISVILFGTEEYTWVVFISCLIIPLSILNDEQSWIYRYKRKAWKFNAYVIAKSIINISLGILLVVSLKKGVIGAQSASLLSSLFVITFSLLLFTRKEYTRKFSWRWAKKMLKFSYPLMLSGLVVWIYSSADRYLILGFQSTSDVGLYSIGATFARPISVLNMAIGMSFYPFFMSIYENEKNEDKPLTKDTSTKIWYLYLAVSLSLCTLISTFSVDVINIIATPEYVMAATVIPFLIISAIFRQSIDITSLGMFLKEKTIHYTWLVALVSGTSLLLNFYLIPKYSYIGAAISNITANLIYLIIAYNLSQRFFYVKRKVFNVSLYILIVFFISVSFPVLQLLFNIDISIYLKILAVLFSFLLPFILGMADIKTIRNLIRS